MAHEELAAAGVFAVAAEDEPPLKVEKRNIEENLHMYRSFMEEIKVRTATIDRYLQRVTDQKGEGDCFTDAESSILQVRYICELIALATVAAHGLVGVTSRIRDEWNADRIFKLLEGMNANSFPRAVRPSTTVKNQFELQKGEMDGGELRKVYNACGENLHRGAMKHFFNEKRRAYDPHELVDWVNRIKALLNMHVVMILEAGIIIYVTLSNENGSVDIGYMQSDGPAILVEN